MTLEEVINKAFMDAPLDRDDAWSVEKAIAVAVRKHYSEQGFSIEIKLKDPEYCYGCPCRNDEQEWCNLYNEFVIHGGRLKQCKEENGE